MRVALDTNVLLSAMISSTGVPNEIYTAWRKKRFTLITCNHQIEELRRASRYARMQGRLQPNRVGAMVNHIRNAEIIQIRPVEEDIADPLDLFLLAMAKTGKADYLVTGDRRAGLLALKNYGRTRILTPSEVVAAFGLGSA